MARYELKIELLSDMCVSDGGVYNSALDLEVCHDKYGFPYIPAKRLKGCLRESALELKDWGMEINLEELFGKKDHGTKNGDNRAALRLENAYVKGYQDLKNNVIHNHNSLILHPQNILGNYTYIRTQTSIDYETGVADEGSLRTMRVVKKGLEFYAEVLLDQKYEEAFRKCCTNLNHMGIARTRGLGEVKLTLTNKEKTAINEKEGTLYSKGDNCFEYAITLREPVICKSVNGGESNTLDYIEGSKILGFIAGKLKEQKKDFIEFINQGELFCSNAYIDVAGQRGSEVSGCIFSIKNEEGKYIDKTRQEEPKGKQLNAMKHCYVTQKDGCLTKKNVNVEEHYHHSRPEDKSIGRAHDGLEGSKMYQMSAICAGQTFRGYITGTKEQIEEIAHMFHKDEVLHIGYSRSSEYGKTVLSECRCTQRQNNILSGCKEIVVKLESPTIIYNENATYSTNPMDLVQEINAWLGIDSDEVKKYIKYTTIGGYNVTWRKRKPTIEAFDKGTLLHYVFSEPMDINVPAEFYIGERITEGYGECSVCKVEKKNEEVGVIGGSGQKQRMECEVDYASANYLVKNICNRLYKEFISKKINEEIAHMSVSEADSSTISNMLVMCKENTSFEKIRNIAEDRYNKTSEQKQQKGKIADRILDKVEKDIITDQLCKEFEEHYNVRNYATDNDKDKADTLEEFLIALKYKVRSKKIEKGGEKIEQ